MIRRNSLRALRGIVAHVHAEAMQSDVYPSWWPLMFVVTILAIFRILWIGVILGQELREVRCINEEAERRRKHESRRDR